MKTMSKTKLQIIMVLAVIAVGGLGAKGLKSMRKLPEAKPQEVHAPLLNAVRVTRTATPMTVSGYGTVEPRMAVQIVPQVAGRIIKRHDQFVAGVFFDANTPLLTIDPRDYQIAVQAAEAGVAQAEVQLAREEAEATVAKREWQRIHPGKEPDSILVYREPQVNSARAQLASAQAQLQKAQLDLERTEITMPFAGRVVETQVDVGQFVERGQNAATVYASDVVEISSG